jgi:hypothetical protein
LTGVASRAMPTSRDTATIRASFYTQISSFVRPSFVRVLSLTAGTSSRQDRGFDVTGNDPGASVQVLIVGKIQTKKDERLNMLRVLVLILGLSGGMVLMANAADEQKPKRPQPTEEQKALRKEMIGKYDKNKDGKLDAEERKAMSAEDKEKWAKAFPPRKKAE